ncbi:EcsC family protein [Bacillus chungangensis]|uniref:ABC transporter substrate-binding protein n=1 Tax=Bacillus chungangensis TaxID=587633 RepID=A0ABT9WN29_9BACI|nr:EcsC family protein [Bacillus chungangensis]MDQ0174558.1 hypothetical protein [Bacillus chungangensis]
MKWTEQDERFWNELLKWEQTLKEFKEGSIDHTSYSRWIQQSFALLPQEVQDRFLATCNSTIFYMHSFLQSSSFQLEAREQIIQSGRIFDHTITNLTDMKHLSLDQLHYLCDQHASKHRLYAFIQGGITGTGKPLAILSDSLVLAVIQMRVIQLIAMTYGYDVQKPSEMMASLKLFRLSTLPKRFLYDGWQELLADTERETQIYFYEGNEAFIQPIYVEEILKQLGKLCLILSIKQKKSTSLPLISMTIGSMINFRMTKRVTDLAAKYYQFRYLLDKKGGES